MRYTYDAAGNKLVKVVDGTVAENNTRLDYSGNFLYENGDLKAIFTSEGRIIPFDNDGSIVYKFEYSLKDHLGNTRVAFSGHSNGQPEVMQVTDYYPFGMVMNQENTFANGVLANKFLYNGKELQDDELAGNSLGWYDYGARFYDPALARWHSVDPMADEYYQWSPYNYSLNNPINNSDPNGMWVETKDGYHTDNPDEILKFFTSLFGIGSGNQPKNEEQARSQASARKALKNVGEGVERLYEAQQEAIALIPGGVLLNAIMDSETGHKSDNNVGTDLGFEIASIYLPGLKFAKGPLTSIVRFSDETVEYIKRLPDGTAQKLINKIPEGFIPTNFTSEGQKVFSNGRVFITPDKTAHIGGRWKAAQKVEYLKSKTTRLGTYDENLARIGN